MVLGWIRRKSSRQAIKDAENEVVRHKESRRNRVCVGPRYPGNPSDYTYVAEYCVRKQRNSARRTARSRKAVPLTKEEEEHLSMLRKYAVDVMKPQKIITGHSMKAVAVAKEAYRRSLFQIPLFIAHAVQQLQHVPREDIGRELKEVAKQWKATHKGFDYSALHTVEYCVLQILGY